MMKRMGAVVFVLTVQACSSSSAPAGPSADQACGDQAHAQCTRLAACSPTDVAIRYGDEAACESRLKKNCVDSLAAPQNGNSPSHAESCSQAYAGWACADYLNNVNIPAACTQPTGAVATGTACAVNGQCQSGFCAIAPASACGTCAALPKAGDSCASLTNCGPGLICTTDTQTCVALAASGAACGKGAPCGAGLSCVGSDPANNVQGKCQAAVEQSGSACDVAQKAGPACDRNAGLVCNSQSKQCAAITVAGGGQACGPVNNQNTPCSASGVCTGSAPGMSGTCTAAAADGAACDTQNGPSCLLPARCIVTGNGTAGTCQLAASTTCP